MKFKNKILLPGLILLLVILFSSCRNTLITHRNLRILYLKMTILPLHDDTVKHLPTGEEQERPDGQDDEAKGTNLFNSGQQVSLWNHGLLMARHRGQRRGRCMVITRVRRVLRET